MKQNGLVGGAIILTTSAILAKLFSAVYRIFLTRILGGVGIGLYQLVFPVYSMCVVLSTTGIPLAISKVVSKNGDSKNLVSFCLKFVSIISIVLAVLIFLLSEPLAESQGDVRIAICFRLLAPSLLVVGICSVLRGYFQGKMNYFPSAVSQVVEQFVKLTCGLLFAVVLIQIGLIYSIVGAIIGILLSEIVSLLILLFNFKRQNFDLNNEEVIDKKQIIKDILPITFTNLILPIAAFVDSVVVVKLLRVNFDAKSAIYLYGLESGAVNNIVTLPTLFSFAMASVIMPSFSAKSNVENKFSHLFQIVFAITIPCVVIFLMAPEVLLKILYSNKLSIGGFNGLEISSNLLKIGGVGTLFLSLNQIMSSYLQANDKRVATIKNLIIGVIVKFIVELSLIVNIDVNIFALALSNTLCYFIVFGLNFLEVRKIKKFKLEKWFYPKILASLLFMIVVYFSLSLMSENITVKLLSFGMAGFAYISSLYLLDVFSIKIFSFKRNNDKKV